MRDVAKWVALPLMLVVAAMAQAKSGWRDVKLEKDGRYAVDTFVMKGADLIGYFEEIKESERVTDVVLVSKQPVNAKEENRFSGIAEAAGLKAHIKEGRAMRDAAAYVAPDAAAPQAGSDTSLAVPQGGDE